MCLLFWLCVWVSLSQAEPWRVDEISGQVGAGLVQTISRLNADDPSQKPLRKAGDGAFAFVFFAFFAQIYVLVSLPTVLACVVLMPPLVDGGVLSRLIMLIQRDIVSWCVCVVASSLVDLCWRQIAVILRLLGRNDKFSGRIPHSLKVLRVCGT